jgi:H+/Cl- antiporter ClcA
MGVVGGLMASVIIRLVDWANSLPQAHPWLLWLLPVCAVAGIWIYERLGLRTWVGTVDGPSAVVADARDNVAPSWRLAPAITAGTTLSLAGGAVVGPDACAKQCGAVVGPVVARPFKLAFAPRENSRTWRVLDAGTAWCKQHFPRAWARKERLAPCLTSPANIVGPVGYASLTGLGATFAGLLGTPLGMCAYTLEIARQNHARVQHVYSLALSCCVAAGVTHVLGTSFAPPTLEGLGAFFVGIARKPVETGRVASAFGAALAALPAPAYVVATVLTCGVAAGCLGAVYRGGMRFMNRNVRKKMHSPYRAVLVGALVVLLLIQGMGWQDYAGMSVGWIPRAFEGNAPTWGFLIVCVLCVLGLGTGMRGGEVTIVLIMGALLGATVARLTGAAASVCAALCMVTFFGVASGCPIAALLCGVRYYGLDLALPLAVTLLVAMLLCRGLLFCGAHLIARLLGRSLDNLEFAAWVWWRELKEPPTQDHILHPRS